MQNFKTLEIFRCDNFQFLTTESSTEEIILDINRVIAFTKVRQKEFDGAYIPYILIWIEGSTTPIVAKKSAFEIISNGLNF